MAMLTRSETDFEIEESWCEGLGMVRKAVAEKRTKSGFAVERSLLESIRELENKNLYSRVMDDATRLQGGRPRISDRLGNATEDPGYVYLMYADDRLFKIGKSVRPKERVKQVRGPSTPMRIGIVWLTLSDSISWWEKHLHLLLAHRRVHGEWFKLSFWDFAYIVSWDAMFLSRPETDDAITNCLNDIARNYEIQPVLNTREVDSAWMGKLEPSFWPTPTADFDPFEAPDFY